ncbi:MAG TPA: hypothetical protein PKB10_07405, partial [Tepidisphaeraceae bacterium]|nr:hypothetical protein [Tepidisphaeraceae bacterium]
DGTDDWIGLIQTALLRDPITHRSRRAGLPSHLSSLVLIDHSSLSLITFRRHFLHQQPATIIQQRND